MKNNLVSTFLSPNALVECSISASIIQPVVTILDNSVSYLIHDSYWIAIHSLVKESIRARSSEQGSILYNITEVNE